MQTITKPQLTAIHTLLGKSGITDKEDKAGIIKEYTGDRTSSSREMTKAEAEGLIGYLKGMDSNTRACDKMRKKIISMAHEMAWKKEDGKIDMKRINSWCLKYGYLHKKLDAYQYPELPRLLSQFEEVYKGFIDNVEPAK